MFPSSSTKASNRPKDILLYLCSIRFVSIIEDIAPTKLLIAIPERINNKLSLFPLKVESLYTMADINKEKNIENNGIAKIYFELNPNAIEITAPRLAPLEIPIIPNQLWDFLKGSALYSHIQLKLLLQ